VHAHSETRLQAAAVLCTDHAARKQRHDGRLQHDDTWHRVPPHHVANAAKAAEGNANESQSILLSLFRFSFHFLFGLLCFFLFLLVEKSFSRTTTAP
jgi:hypothetical protein